MDYYRTMKQRVLKVHAADPSLNTADIAARVGASKNWVRSISRACELNIPHSRIGRPLGSTGSRWYYKSKRRAA
jgi:hypothetical protein